MFEKVADRGSVVPDDQRGCGYLEPDKTYLRADVVAGADSGIPPFVEFEEPILFLEDHFRSYKRIDGEKFLAAVASGQSALTGTNPKGEVERHFQRLLEETAPGGEDYGRMTAHDAQDLIMWTGESYYGEPEDFVREARVQGVNKAIRVSANQDPPRVIPGRTKLFIVHPSAIPTDVNGDGNTLQEAISEALEGVTGDDARSDVARDVEENFETVRHPGVIGYTYLSRIIRTKPAEGPLPKYVENYAEQDLLDIVDRGNRVSYDDDDHPLADYEGEDDEDEEEAMHEPDPDDGKRREVLEDIPFQALRRRVPEDVYIGKNPTKDAVIDALIEHTNAGVEQ